MIDIKNGMVFIPTFCKERRSLYNPNIPVEWILRMGLNLRIPRDACLS